jgi:hypothetical protein
MLREALSGITVAVCLVGSAIAGGISYTQVTFQTTDCDGKTGFASVDLERIWRINDAGCATPDKPNEKLLQVLVKSLSGVTNYEVYIVNPDEAASIQTQIKAHMASKRKALEGSDTVIIEH